MAVTIQQNVGMRKFLCSLVVVVCIGLTVRSSDAEQIRLRSAVPDELAEAWEQFQRTVQEWGERLRERFGGGRSARERQPMISQMLAYKEFLGLSAEQVKKLEQIRDNFQRQAIRNEADVRIAELDIAALLDNPTTDLAKVEAKIREAEKLRADLRIVRVRAVEQAKAVLTAEQRKKFHEKIDTVPSRRSSQNPSATGKEAPSP
ncbi:MAG TPA: periplasmic heavy metal sensor [Methylomirabilota bacterium]|nr:periplasmic heavy metal sensor [Methylomirabilota bacterium]